MGRNKIKIEKIKIDRIRHVTFYKRKKGLLKKAMELSLLCGVKVFLCIVDKNQKSMIYSSEKDISKLVSSFIIPYQNSREMFSDDNYKDLYEEKDDSEDISEDIKEDFSENTEKEAIKIDTISVDGIKQRKKLNERTCKIQSKFYTKSISNNIEKDREIKCCAPTDIISTEIISGIEKIKSKLCLKIQIPESNRTETKLSSISESKEDYNEKNSSFGISNDNIPSRFKSSAFKSIGLKIDIPRKTDEKSNLQILENATINNTESAENIYKFDQFCESNKKTLMPNIINDFNQFKNPLTTISNKGPENSINNSYNNFFISNNIWNNFNQDLGFTSNKRYRDDMFLNISPNLSVTNDRPLTPIYGQMSPELSKIFIYNNNGYNSLAPTPLPIKNYIIENPNSNRKKLLSESKKEFNFGNAINEEESGRVLRLKKEAEEKISNNKKVFSCNKNKISGVVYEPKNLFYSWAIQNSQNNLVKNKTKSNSKLEKIKKTK